MAQVLLVLFLLIPPKSHLRAFSRAGEASSSLAMSKFTRCIIAFVRELDFLTLSGHSDR